MLRKRPCRICRRWFQPHSRVKARQRVCGSHECQRERHRRACEQWRRRNPDYDRDRRLRERLAQPEAVPETDPVGKLDWEVARDAVGLQVAVVVEESARLIVDWARDAVAPQQADITGKSDGLRGGEPQDELGAARAPP